MKRGIVYYKDTNNIGDDVQTLAAKNILGKVDSYLDREDLHNYNGPDLKLLCNGYFMKDPTHWPPSNKIEPLFISFHISALNACSEKMANGSLANYYNQFQPIGCRDFRTKELLGQHGVDAYYSSCLTLTLESSQSKSNSGEIIFADAFLKTKSDEYESYFIDKMVPKSLANNVAVIHHEQARNHLSIEDRMKTTQELIDRYAAARLVFTSRIHCALPCLAIGTPVYFMDLGYDRKDGRSRFNGILDMMNVLNQNNFALSSSKPYAKVFRKLNAFKLLNNQDYSKIINWDLTFEKSDQQKEITENLRSKVSDFFKD